MKRRVLSLCLAGALLAGLFGCTQPEPATSAAPQPTPAATAAPTPVAETPVVSAAALPSLLGERETLYDPDLAPNVPAFAIADDFSNLANADELAYWSEEARAMLHENGFITVQTNEYEFYSLYERNRYSYSPNFVTVDSMLHTYHLYFLYLQKQVEEAELAPRLLALSTAMQQQSQAQLDELAGTDWENAARRNLAFFSVGVSLLDPAAAVPESVAEPVAAELALIDGAAGIALSPVMNLGSTAADGVMEDYTQYIPRSYYAGNETLERYFKAMMYYGRLTFRAADTDATRSALLLCLGLQQAGVQADWDRIYAVTAFFAGVSDDAVAPDYLPLIESAYGALPETAALPGEPEAFAAFQQQAEQLAPAAINSMPIWDGQDRDEATAGFRFLGQRFTLDAAVFQQLIYPAVQPDEAGSQRMLPDALDLPAAFGSDTALQILTEQGAAAYPGYTENLESLRAALEKAPAETWSASLYAAWLDALRPLAEEKGEGWPQYMQSEAWAKKDLATMLGSWAELKHDTALYAKQVYAEMGGGIEPVDDRGYVEAEPAVFGKLSALCTATANGLDALGLLSDTQAADLAKMAELNRQLMTIAEKELRGELPTDEEFELIRSFGGQLEHFWTEAVADEAAGIYTPMQMPAALVADVATDPNGSVLQVGTGIQTIYVVVEVDGSPRLASGTVFGFYQFAQPMDERLTDEEWQAQLGLSFDENIGFVEPQNRPQPVEWSRDATLLTTYAMG